MRETYVTERSDTGTSKYDDAQTATYGLGTKGRTYKPDYPANSGGDQQLDLLSQLVANTTAKDELAGLVLQPIADVAWQVLNQFGQPASVPSTMFDSSTPDPATHLQSQLAATPESPRTTDVGPGGVTNGDFLASIFVGLARIFHECRTG